MTVGSMKWCALAALVVGSCQAAAVADDGRPSQATLAAMGLSGLSPLSDDEALAVRGHGFGATAYGASFAVVAVRGGKAGSNNGYHAHGPRKASGSNYSEALAVVEYSRRGKGGPPAHGGGHKRPRMIEPHGKRGGDGYGGKHSSGKHSGNKHSSGGMRGGGKHGGGHGGKGGGGHGAPQVRSIGVFAGGSSVGKIK